MTTFATAIGFKTSSATLRAAGFLAVRTAHTVGFLADTAAPTPRLSADLAALTLGAGWLLADSTAVARIRLTVTAALTVLELTDCTPAGAGILLAVRAAALALILRFLAGLAAGATSQSFIAFLAAITIVLVLFTERAACADSAFS